MLVSCVQLCQSACQIPHLPARSPICLSDLQSGRQIPNLPDRSPICLSDPQSACQIPNLPVRYPIWLPNPQCFWLPAVQNLYIRYSLACCAKSIHSLACCAKSIYSLACCAKSIHMYSHAFVNLVTLHPVTSWYVVRVHLAELG